MSSSYRQIFKSTAVVGGAQMIMIVIGIIRTKVLALLLGPSGIAIAGLYQSATTMIGTVTSMGIGASGVRQIAEASSTGDEKKIARTTITLRRAAAISGLIGMTVVLLLCVPLSKLSFGDDSHWQGIALISLTLLFAGISGGQIALLQGLRKIREQAMAALCGSVLGAVASISLVVFLGEKGIAPYLVVIAAFGILTSWWFARHVPVRPLRLSWRETWAEARPLLGLGAAFMVSGLFSTGASYLSNILIRRELGEESLGLYQATWTLSTLYVGIILSAMGADFAPRLTAAANDHPQMNRLVNEQTEMGLLFAVPGVLATITLAPWVLLVFYSSEFMGAGEIIRWQIIGIALRVVCWPLGLIYIAKGRSKLFMCYEGVFSSLGILLLWCGMRLWGLPGIGAAFAAQYVIVTIVNLLIARSICGFSWSGRCLKILTAASVLVALAFAAAVLLPQAWALTAGVTLTLTAGLACLWAMQTLLQINAWQMLRKKFGLAS